MNDSIRTNRGIVPAFHPLWERVMPLQMYFAVAIGGALGSVARYFLSGLIANAFGQTFPWGTFVVNATGSFIIGFFATLSGPGGRLLVNATVRQFVMVGICGGYTTFSSFSLQTLNLANDGEWLYAGGNIAGSVAVCLLFVWMGSIFAAALNQARGI